MAFLTDRTLASGVTLNDLIHVVITGDTSQNPAGSSFKATIEQVKDALTPFFSGGTDTFVTGGTYSAGTATFTNNSGDTFNVTGFTQPFSGGSGNCITDLYVTRLHGCSPITVNDSLIITSGENLTSDSGNSELDLRADGIDSTFTLRSSSGYSESYFYGTPTYAEMAFGFGTSNFAAVSTSSGNASMDIQNTSLVPSSGAYISPNQIGITNSDLSAGFSSIKVVDLDGGNAELTSTLPNVGIAINSSITFLNGLDSSVALGVESGTGKTDNVAYMTTAGFIGNKDVYEGLLDRETLSANRAWELPDKSGTVALLSDIFTGNTSGTCITDIFVTNVYGCSPLHIEPSGLNDVYIVENGGNVGIGTTSPGGLLELYTSDNNSSINNRLRFRNNDAIAGPGGGTEEFIGLIDFYGNENQGDGVRSYIGTVQDGNAQTSIIFGTTDAASGITLNPTAVGGFPSEAMRIDPTGQVAVGIGQINDIEAKLHVNNTDSGYSFLVEDSANPDTTPFLINSGGTTSIGTEKIYRATPGGTETKLQASIGDSGLPFSGLPISTTAIFESNTSNNIGLISPDANVNQIYFGTPSDAFGAYLRWDYTNRDFILSTGNVLGKTIFQTANGVEAARIDENGNFGIGTNTPQFTLDVAGETRMSGSGQNILTIIGSGDTQPLFKVEGSSGELFSITDSLTGSLFTVNDVSGLAILEVFDDNTVHMGSNQAPSLNTTVVTNPGTGLSTVYSLPMSAYTGAWYEYTVSNTGGVRAGSIMSVFSGNTAVLNEYSTTDIGNTSDIQFSVSADTTNAYLQVSAVTTGWEVKTIVRSI